MAKLAEPEWWAGVSAVLTPLIELGEAEQAPLATLIDALATAGEALCGLGLWEKEDGRSLSSLVEESAAPRGRGRHDARPGGPARRAPRPDGYRRGPPIHGAVIRAWRFTACWKRA